MNDIRLLPAYATNPTSGVRYPTPRKDRIKDSIKDMLDKCKTLYSHANETFSSMQTNVSQSTQSNRPFRKRVKGFFKKSLLLPAIILGLFALVAGYMIINGMNNNSNVLDSSDQRIEIKKPKAQQTLNKSFAFPLRDTAGKEVSKLQYVIETAELRDEIIVKGQRATSVKGRTFLIINLKITNDFNQPITLNSRDYVRLIVGNSKERLAPDIHNDPVEIQPISTKYTRLGFPINDTDNTLTLQVGEIRGAKQTIKLDLK